MQFSIQKCPLIFSPKNGSIPSVKHKSYNSCKTYIAMLSLGVRFIWVVRLVRNLFNLNQSKSYQNEPKTVRFKKDFRLV